MPIDIVLSLLSFIIGRFIIFAGNLVLKDT